jgi:hypothetical protein
MMKTATHRGEQEQTVETTRARVEELEAEQRAVLGALEAACRAARAEEMIALHDRLPALKKELKDAQAHWLAARWGELAVRRAELDRHIATLEEQLAKAEADVRASQLHIAKANVGLNQGYLTGRTGVLFGEGGPGVQEYQERQQRARTVATQLHARKTEQRNLDLEQARLDRELAAWPDRE